MPKDKEKFKMAMEEARRDLQHRLEEVLGKEHALTLMAALPPTEAATKSDIEDLRQATKSDIADLRQATKSDIADLRQATKADLQAEIEGLGTGLRGEMRAMEGRVNERIDLKVEASEHRMVAALERGLGDLRKELGDLRKEMVAQTRVFVFSSLTAVVTVGGLAVAAGRLG